MNFFKPIFDEYARILRCEPRRGWSRKKRIRKKQEKKSKQQQIDKFKMMKKVAELAKMPEGEGKTFQFQRYTGANIKIPTPDKTKT